MDETDNMLYSFVLTVPPDSPSWTLADIVGAIEAAVGLLQRGASIGRASGTRPELVWCGGHVHQAEAVRSGITGMAELDCRNAARGTVGVTLAPEIVSNERKL